MGVMFIKYRGNSEFYSAILTRAIPIFGVGLILYLIPSDFIINLY